LINCVLRMKYSTSLTAAAKHWRYDRIMKYQLYVTMQRTCSYCQQPHQSYMCACTYEMCASSLVYPAHTHVASYLLLRCDPVLYYVCLCRRLRCLSCQCMVWATAWAACCTC
jgi:hypothetical protein